MKKGIKKTSLMIAIVIGILVIAFISIKSRRIDEVEVSNINFNTVQAGSYSGEYAANLVKVKVNVRVNEGRIKEITIDEHENCLGKKAEIITDKILEKQSLQVDIVSGATASSNAIKKAVEIALKKGIAAH